MATTQAAQPHPEAPTRFQSIAQARPEHAKAPKASKPSLPREPVIGSRWEFKDRFGRIVWELTGEDASFGFYPFVMTVVETEGMRAHPVHGRKLGETMTVELAWFEHRTDARRVG